MHVLVVEDSSDDARLIIHELKMAGFQIISERIQSAQELEQALNAKNWDIVLSDYTLPQYTAIDVLKAVKEKNPDLPCIVISGTIGEETAVAAMQAGAQDFFVKGRLKRLPLAVKRELAEAENTRQKRKAEQELREAESRLTTEREEALRQQTAAREKIERLYHEAQESNRIKEEFLTTLSHELRTPMTAITGWSDLLFRGECKVEDYPVAFSSIHRNAHAQNKLIDDVLDLSRIVTGKLKIESAPVDLMEISKIAVESVQLSLHAKSLILNINGDPTTGLVFGDPVRLQQIIWNILSNAIKFTPIGGRITLDIRPAGGMVEIQITDTGEGIDAKFLPYIFDRFQQVDGSLTRRHGGLGLGLAIVRDLVELHGGQVEAKSEGIEKGTTVLIQFPMMARHRSFLNGWNNPVNNLEIRIDQNQKLLKNLRILVVDDSLDNCILLNAILKRHGAEVVIADSAREAFRLFGERPLDVLLCDIEMPEENGFELIRRIRKSGNRGATIPAAAVTAHVRADDVAKAIAAGFNQHISKPVKETKLVRSIAQIAGRKQILALNCM